MKDPFQKLEEQSGHTLILEACLSYILFVDGEFQEISSITEEDFPLLLYACICWHCHRKSLQAEPTYPLVEEHFQRWLNSPSTFQIWLIFGLSDIGDNFLNLDQRSGTSNFKNAHFTIYSDSISAYDLYQNHIPDSGVAISWQALLGMNQELKAVQEFTRSTACNLIKSNEENAKEAIGGILHAASLCGKLPIMRQVLEWNLDINTVGGYSGTALQAATVDGNKPMVELLLEMGADPDRVGGRYGAALQAATVLGNKAIVELLLEMGADLDRVGGYYGTALQAAAAMGHTEVVDFLLEQGSDPSILSGPHGRIASQAAAFAGYVEILELLHVHGTDLNAIGGKYETVSQAAAYPLHEAVKFKDLWLMQFLLDQGCDIEGIDTKGLKPLQVAAKYSTESAAWLLKNDCNIHAIGRYGETALQLAAEHIRLENTEKLLDAGASVNPVAGEQGSGLLATVKTPYGVRNSDYDQRLKVLNRLLEKGASSEHIQRALEEARLQAAQRAKQEAHEFYTEVITMLEKAKAE